MNHALWASLLVTAGLLSGCGGGSSNSSSSSDGGSTPVIPSSTGAKVTLTGVAAKGLMANADVTVLPINSDGSVGTTALATTTTDSQGAYTLSFEGTQGQPVVVRVSAKADGSTTHADEVTGASQPLPAGFALRALLVPASSGTSSASVSVTPFSELTVAAAAKASGGVTAANARQAVSTVTQLLGFDPSGVTPKPVASASGSNEQALALMLTAVSKLASTGALGCATGTPGDKTRCVVEALSGAASTSSLKLTSSGGTDVSTALSNAVASVVADNSLSGGIGSQVVAIIVANLGCSGSACTPATAGGSTGASETAVAIAAAKLLVAEMKSDWSAMFSTGGVTSIAGGAVNKEAYAFQTALDGVDVPLDMLGKDLGALLLGVDLYNDYKAQRTTLVSRGRGGDQGLVAGNAPSATAAGCTLYQDSAVTVVTTAVSNANYIACNARYHVTVSGTGGNTVTTEWRHGFTITPAADGSFTYLTRARRAVRTCVNGSCTTTANVALQTDSTGAALPAFNGTLTPTLSGTYGDITAFTLSGELPAAFEGNGGTALVGHVNVVSMSGTQVSPSTGSATSTLQGTLVSKDSSGATTGTLAVKPGSTVVSIPVGIDASGNEVNPASAASLGLHGGTLSALTVDLVFTTAQAEFEGVLSATDSVWDVSGTQLQPTKATLSGALRNIGSTGTLTEFLKGVLTASTTGWAGYDTTKPDSASNQYTINLGFTGTLTAANRPTLELTLASGWRRDGTNSGDGTRLPVAMQYRTLVAGQPKLVVKLTADRVTGRGPNNSDVGDIGLITLTEASAGLSMAWTAGATSADLMHGSTKIGLFDTAAGLLTFTDNSFVSLDIGL